MEPARNDKTQSAVLHEKALEQAKKLVADKDNLFKLYKKAAEYLKKVLDKRKAGLVLDFHKVHMQYLAIVYAAVLKVENAGSAIAQLDANLNAFMSAAEKEMQSAAEVPSDPLRNYSATQLYLYANDPVFKMLYNDTVTTQRELTKAALEPLVELGDQGRRISEETKSIYKELNDKLDAMVPETQVEKDLIKRNKQNLSDIYRKLTKLDGVNGRLAQAISDMQEENEAANHYPLM
ncbi:hypothetical protein ACFSL6_02655 [Paenibacillus thailandensis]|uniref:Uncharacterized protein n=1 Tax=Paenibacillus thailandensis TaxID=393250 RepID=A0ABW5QUY1_9BACL